MHAVAVVTFWCLWSQPRTQRYPSKRRRSFLHIRFIGNNLPASTVTRAASAGRSIPSSSTLHFRASFIHVDRSTAQLRAVQCRDRFLAVRGIGHFNKRKAPRTTCVAISHERNASNGAMLGEKLTQIVLAGAEVQIADKNVFHEMLRVGELFEWSMSAAGTRLRFGGWPEHFKRAQEYSTCYRCRRRTVCTEAEMHKRRLKAVHTPTVNNLDPLGGRLITNDPHSRPPQALLCSLGQRRDRNGARAEVHASKILLTSRRCQP